MTEIHKVSVDKKSEKEGYSYDAVDFCSVFSGAGVENGLLLKICGKAVGIILSLIGFVLSLAFGMAMFGLSMAFGAVLFVLALVVLVVKIIL